MTEAGRTIAERYELVSTLGEGGMGVVWRARDTRLGRAVAVKLLAASSLGSDVARRRLIREARAAAALEHEGIIRVYDVGETEDGGAFLVMELVRGTSFRAELAAKKASLARIAAVIVQAARALDVAHRAGIIHRDVKPDNIMIRENGSAIVVDFGVAKPVATELVASAETVAGVTNASLTGVGQLVGTPAYLSPEQARGAEVTPATDQFALAVTTYEAMTGKLPWSGGGVVEIVASILRDDPEPTTTHVPDVPRAIEVVLFRALAKDPAQRWPDLAAFAGALEEAAIGLPADPAMRPSGRTPIESSRTPAGAAVTHAQTTASPPKAPPRALIALVGLAAIAGASYLAFGRIRPPSAGDPIAASSAPAFACPPFVVAQADETWLGMSAAGLACDRLALSRGGVDGRALGPAELAGTPREPSAALPVIFERADERASAVAAASRAARWIDGHVDKQPTGFIVRVVVRDAKGAETARGEGRGVELYEAVRDAMKPALSPATKGELAVLQSELDVGSVDAALDLFDLHTAVLIEDPVSLAESCRKVAARTDLAPRVAYLARSRCAQKLRTGESAGPPPPLDESTPGSLVTTALAHGTAGGPAGARERVARLEQMRDRTASIEAKSRLTAAAAEILYGVGDERSRELARAAVQLSPRALDWRVSAWHRITFAAEGDVAMMSQIVRWQPWEPVAQAVRVPREKLVDSSQRAVPIRRAYLLAQRGYFAYGYGTELLLEGRFEDARSLAEQTKDDLLRMDIMVAEAHYGAVLAKVPRVLAELQPSDATASLAFRVAHDGVRAGLVLERPADFVGDSVDRWVMSDPHHVVDGVVPFASLVTVCCLAPRAVGKRCIGRLVSLRAEGRLPVIFAGAETTLLGAQRYVEGDHVGAMKAWRTLLRSPRWLQEPLRDPMAIAFDLANEPDLGTEMDSPTVATVDAPRTAELAWVREARRAHKRGDLATARKLAEAVVDKWRFADDDVPAMREMKTLLTKLPK